VQREDLSWDTQFNVASNANEVLALGPDDEPIIAGGINAGRPTHITKVGEPIGQFYGWQIEGLYESEEEIQNNPSYDDAQVGNIRPLDTNGDGAADATMDAGTADTGGGGDPGLKPGCCANEEWAKGAVSYQNDQDWFEYQHPCPGQDCTIRVHYDIEGGPVDTAMNVYQAGASNPWLSAFDVDQKERQDARSGTYGGLTSQARCAYAYQGHATGDDSTYHYGLKVSDEVESVSREDVTITDQSSRDWSPEQTYRVCVEKISDSCEEPPCKVYENGCGPP